MDKVPHARRRTDFQVSDEIAKRHLHTLKAFGLTFVITIAAFAGFGCYAWRVYSRFKAGEDRYHQILEYAGVVTHLDEVLTMSARMAAATGDLSWEERYRSFEPKLDAAIKGAMAMAPETFMAKSVAKTDAANIELVAMENQAFELVRQKKRQQAAALLSSEEYQDQKRVYSHGMQLLTNALSEHIRKDADKSQTLALGGIVFVGLFIFVATLSGVGAIQMRKHMTVRTQAEQSVRRAYEELEATHQELKLMQSQIVQNEKLASIGQLAAGVAHEMNTPVGFVASNFQTLESYVGKMKKMLGTYEELVRELEKNEAGDLTVRTDTIDRARSDMKIDFILEDVQGLFDDSREGLARVTDIVQNLRDFSRVDQPGSLDEYDLNKGLEATLIVATNEIKYDAEVRTQLAELPPIRCHSGQINQVLLNILVNAAQAIRSQDREDKGTISIRTYATEDDVVCEMSNDGPTIESDKLSKIFEPFYTTKPAGKGTGLGLSVSYDIIVHKHEGKLLVESEAGRGTKFTIKLPIRHKESEIEQEIENNGHKKSVIC